MKRLNGIWVCLALFWVAMAAQARTMHFYYTDPQGTVLAKTDAQGNILARYDYKPYGGVVNGQGPNGPGYTGHEYDTETGLVYMQARYYDPVGRFLSPDPVEPGAGTLFGFNRYDYASNNPIINIDPTGMAPGDEADFNNSAYPVEITNFGSRGSNVASRSSAMGKEFRMRKSSSSNYSRVMSAGLEGEYGGALIGETFVKFLYERLFPHMTVTGIWQRKPELVATVMGANGGGAELKYNLTNGERGASIVTPGYGAHASVDTNLLTLTYRGAGSAESPVRITGGLSYDFHDVVGGDVTLEYGPPSTLRVSFDGGVGYGEGWYVFSVGVVKK